MDPMYLALSLFRRRHYDKCVEVCTSILDKQPLDQAAWCLKMRAMTQRVYVDDIESDDMSQDDFLDDSALASIPRPGTSMRTAATTAAASTSLGARPRTSTGRPISGITRPGTQTARPGSALDRVRTARPITGQSARAIRLGTAAMLTQKDGPFIQTSRLNLAKYATNQTLNKALFEYLFYHEGDVRNAMELAVQATQACDYKDWWWKVQLAKCYLALRLVREAEQQLRSALKQHHNVETFIRLVRIYIRLDQPLSASEICRAGLEVFPNDVSIMTEMARLSEALNDAPSSVKYYRNIVIEDPMNTEAIACIGLYHFYNNQPEMALRYYRRVLAMGAHSAELYNNLGLCCLYSQQLDLTLACFQRALDLATEPMITGEIWYNLSHVAMRICFYGDLSTLSNSKRNMYRTQQAAGDLELAIQCLNLCLSSDPTHAPAFNNLAVLHHKMGHTNLSKAYLSSAKSNQTLLSEANINLQFLLDH